MAPVSPTFLRSLVTSSTIEGDDARALVALARSLRAGSDARLRGKHIVLFSQAAGGGAGARRIERAARALGARVAHVEPAPAWLRPSAPIDLQAARLFETLYDAAACEDLPHDFALRLQSLLSMPVYDGLARDDHPLFGLLPHLADDVQAPPREEDRQALLQAALVGSLL
jgi:ornithine carbamoyltransferase